MFRPDIQENPHCRLQCWLDPAHEELAGVLSSKVDLILVCGERFLNIFPALLSQLTRLKVVSDLEQLTLAHTLDDEGPVTEGVLTPFLHHGLPEGFTDNLAVADCQNLQHLQVEKWEKKHYMYSNKNLAGRLNDLSFLFHLKLT